MGERLVDVVKLHALGGVISEYRLQTGDVPEERRSGEAAEHKNGISAFQAAELEFEALSVVRGEVG